jgi:putative nucleotidyltransferase-like protein
VSPPPTAFVDASLGLPPSAGCWPTARQRLLLRATLLDGAVARDAWTEWRRTTDFASVDPASRRIFPLLYRNLHQLGVDDPVVRELKENFARTYFRNRVLFARAADVLRALGSAGIPTMVLKGSALVPLHYRDPGLRPMDDFDVLVPVEQARAAMDVLARSGWTPAHRHPELRIPIVHSTSFADAVYRQLDLHWHVIGEGWHASLDERFWKASVPVDIEGVATRALSPAHQLLHLIAHGIRWDDPSPIRWIADAMAVIRSDGDSIDWQALADEAVVRHLTLPVGDGLAYLAEHLDAPIPAATLGALRSVPVPRLERFNYEFQTREYWAPSAVEILKTLRYDYQRLATSVPFRERPVVFVRRVQDRFQLKSAWHVPLVMSSAMLRRGVRAIRGASTSVRGGRG